MCAVPASPDHPCASMRRAAHVGASPTLQPSPHPSGNLGGLALGSQLTTRDAPDFAIS
jgi:hypothetical protein